MSKLEGLECVGAIMVATGIVLIVVGLSGLLSSGVCI